MGSGSSRALTSSNSLVSAITNPAQSGGVQRSIWNREAYIVVKTRKEFLELYKAEPQFAKAVSASVSAAASGAANNGPAEGPLASFALSLLFFNPKSEQKININDKPRSFINFGDLERFFPKELTQTNSTTSAPEAQQPDFVATVSERLANAVERVSSRTFEPLIDDPATYKGNAGFLPAIDVSEPSSPARSLKELLKNVDLKALILPAALTVGVAASLTQLRSFVRA